MLGICFTVSSVLISTYLVEGNSIKITGLQKRILNNDNLIDTRWNDNKSFESKINTSLLLLASNQSKSISKSTIRKIIYPVEIKRFAVQALIDIRDDYYDQAVDDIDNAYIENLEIRDEISYLDQINQRLKIISIFLNIIGLALIFSKEILLV